MDNNPNYINFLTHFYEYLNEKLKYRDVTCIILKVLPWQICYYCFCSPSQSLVELESVIKATAPYFEHTAPLTYSLWFSYAYRQVCCLPQETCVLYCIEWMQKTDTLYPFMYLCMRTWKNIYFKDFLHLKSLH